MNNVATVLSVVAVSLSLTAASAHAEFKGEKVFSQKCTMCHVVRGKGGAIGPELTGITSRMSVGDIRAHLENPKKRNPASAMPAFRTLPKAEMDPLMEYLATLK